MERTWPKPSELQTWVAILGATRCNTYFRNRTWLYVAINPTSYGSVPTIHSAAKCLAFLCLHHWIMRSSSPRDVHFESRKTFLHENAIRCKTVRKITSLQNGAAKCLAGLCLHHWIMRSSRPRDVRFESRKTFPAMRCAKTVRKITSLHKTESYSLYAHPSLGSVAQKRELREPLGRRPRSLKEKEAEAIPAFFCRLWLLFVSCFVLTDRQTDGND